jgi:hypothetical protein
VSAAPRRIAITVAIVYVAVVAVIGAIAIHYEMILDELAVELPPLTKWMLHAHRYTPVFLLLSVPAILCAISTTLSGTQRRALLAVSSVGLILLGAWFGLIWLGMGLLVYKLDQIVP